MRGGRRQNKATFRRANVVRRTIHDLVEGSRMGSPAALAVAIQTLDRGFGCAVDGELHAATIAPARHHCRGQRERLQ